MREAVKRSGNEEKGEKQRTRSLLGDPLQKEISPEKGIPPG